MRGTKWESSCHRKYAARAVARELLVRIQFKRFGGFGGTRLSAELNTESLTPADANVLRELIRAADFFRLPPAVSSPDAADGFRYLVTVESADERHSVSTTDPAPSPALRALLDYLTKVAKRATGARGSDHPRENHQQSK
jgi:Emfourin